MKRERTLFLAAIFAGMTLLSPAAAWAQKKVATVPASKVTRVEMSASSGTDPFLSNGQNVYAAFSDHPASVNFKGTIGINLPAAVTYRWERSDGTVTPTRSLQISGGSAQVNDTWTNLCAMNPNMANSFYQRSEVLHVLSPTDLRSSPFQVGCVEISHVKISANLAGAQNAGSSHPIYTGACPVTISFRGPVQSTGPVAITYHWERSDGSKSPSMQASATGSGSAWEAQVSDSISTTGPIGTTYLADDTLHITMPLDVAIPSFGKVGMTCKALAARP